MKKTKIVYWIVTGLFCAMMLMMSVTDLIPTPEAAAGFKHIGFPYFMLGFIGVARILGVIALLAPGFPRIKEWAYAGFFFDFVGAIAAVTATGDPLYYNLIAVGCIGLMLASYFLYHKLRRTTTMHLARNRTAGMAA